MEGKKERGEKDELKNDPEMKIIPHYKSNFSENKKSAYEPKIEKLYKFESKKEEENQLKEDFIES